MPLPLPLPLPLGLNDTSTNQCSPSPAMTLTLGLNGPLKRWTISPVDSIRGWAPGSYVNVFSDLWLKGLFKAPYGVVFAFLLIQCKWQLRYIYTRWMRKKANVKAISFWKRILLTSAWSWRLTENSIEAIWLSLSIPFCVDTALQFITH